MNKFVNALKNESNFTKTENDAIALKSTNSSLLDLFGQIGALRPRTESDIEAMFSKAFAENSLFATKMAFYARDIRFGGLGERRVFRVILKFIARLYPEIIEKNIKNIPYFGRWDDLYVLINTPVESLMWDFIKKQWNEDINGMNKMIPISTMAKWLKSINTSSADSVKLGKLTAQKIGLFESSYRKMLSKMRKYIDIVEIKMSANKWTEINYPSVPSKAMSNYRKAFSKHDLNGFASYISKVEKGEEKINSSTLFPYDILQKMGIVCHNKFMSFSNYDKVLEAQWKALPNYIDGENNVLVMADTSGSMMSDNGRPLATSVGLSIYFAERNHGIFKNIFMTFSSEPSFIELKGNSLYEKIKCIPAIVSNTNLESAFKLILETAIKNNLKSEDLPKSLVIISDMQFDMCQTYKWTFYDEMKARFNINGYDIPNIIFWQVESRRDTFHATSSYKGVQLASGQSAATFKTILKNIGKTPYEAMITTLNNPVYDCILI